MDNLGFFENKILQGITSEYEVNYVTIGRCVNPNEDDLIRTITVNRNGKKTPVVLIHGFLSALGLWIHNIDQLARDRAVYAIDLLGFGSSGRQTFSNDALEAERQMVKSIEAWVTMVLGSRHFVPVGHSMGGFLVSAYALQHPERVAHLILADCGGFLLKRPTETFHLG